MAKRRIQTDKMKEMVDLELPGDPFSCLDRFYLFFGAKIDKDTKRLFFKARIFTKQGEYDTITS